MATWNRLPFHPEQLHFPVDAGGIACQCAVRGQGDAADRRFVTGDVIHIIVVIGRLKGIAR